MKKNLLVIILSLMFCFSVFGQTPGTLNYPASLDNLDTLFRTADKAQSTLSTAINANATTIPLAGAATFPASGAVVIESEIIFFTGKSGNNLTGAIRGASGTTALSHPSRANVRGAILAVHHNTQSQALINLQTKLGIGNTTTDINKFLIGSAAGTSVWRLLAASDIPPLDAAKVTSGIFSTSRLGSGTANNTTYLRGDGVWAVPSGSGGSLPTGTVTVASGQNFASVTNGAVSVNSIIVPVAKSNDATCSVKNYVASSGTFTINMTANCTNATTVGFVIF